jgi:hypothetical protein
MSVLLIVVGTLVTAVGVGMIGYGIPINEFSFGNTLIVAGTTAVVGGIIVFAIGVAVGQLQRLADMVTTRIPDQPSRPLEVFEPPSAARAAPAPTRIPFPPRPKPATEIPETIPAPPAPAAPVAEEHPVPVATPMLRNPDMPVAAVEQFEVQEYADVSLSPQEATASAAPVEVAEQAPPPPPDGIIAPPAVERRPTPSPAFEDEPLRSMVPPMPPPPPRMEPQSQSSYFDTMWPAGSRPAKRPLPEEPYPESKPELPPAPAAAAPGEPAAILKSGVVDGMGYTLYVDGSIEAELPNGTLRFASINELRDHLAKSA